MAKHRKSNKRASSSAALTGTPTRGLTRRQVAKRSERRRPAALILASAAAAGLSAALVFGHATNNTAEGLNVQLAAAVIGIGGRGDPTSANIPAKLNHTVFPRPGFDTYIPVNYPASFFIDDSVTAGVPVLHQEITNYRKNNPNSPTILVVGYSEGTIVAEQERRTLGASNIPASQLSFLMIASPNVPNGGIFARFPDVSLFIVTSNGAAQPSKFDTTYVTNEYDPYADFPAYFNPLSLLNSAVAVMYVHPDQFYDPINLNAPKVIKTEVTNSAGGHDTYYFVVADHLPLFQPVRDAAAAIGASILTEPVLAAIEPFVRIVVDMGYTDRQNLHPEVPTTFSLITPPARIVESLAATPNAISRGANNSVGGVTSSTPLSTPFTTALANSSSTSPASGLQAPPQLSIFSNPSINPLANGSQSTSPFTNGNRFAPNTTGVTTNPGGTGLLGGNPSPSGISPATAPGGSHTQSGAGAPGAGGTGGSQSSPAA